MSREDAFIRTYREITGASEFSARSTFILYDAFAAEGLIEGITWVQTIPVPAMIAVELEKRAPHEGA